jgi:hypothetical protein
MHAKKRMTLLARFGTCALCMRQSLAISLGLCLIAGALEQTEMRTTKLVIAALALAAGLLFFLHVIGFALRDSRRRSLRYSNRERPTDSLNPLLGRRVALKFFLTSVFVALSATVGRAVYADRLSDCLNCCAKRLQECGATDSKCNVLYQNCVNSCNSQGETPADWRCW